jgi:hypothetical protein
VCRSQAGTLQTLSDALVAEGYPVQFVLLSDANATDFVGRADVPLFRDPSAGRMTWSEHAPGAVKHDTFVYARDGTRTVFWDASAQDLSKWSADIRAAVEAQGM